MKRALRFLEENDVCYIIDPEMKGCFANPPEGIVYIGTKNLTKREILSVIFHEYAHVWSYRNNKYKKYNGMGYLSKKYLRKIALRAERYTDKKGAEFMKQFYPSQKYWFGYSEPNVAKLLKAYYGY